MEDHPRARSHLGGLEKGLVLIQGHLGLAPVELQTIDCMATSKVCTMMFEHNEEYQPDVFSKRAQVTIFKSPFSIDVSRWSAGQQQVVEHQ